ncbi:MAG: SLC13 family permease, partial [Ilumatobacteraceae bacterium]
GDALEINATAAAFVGVSVLLVTRVLTWADMAANSSAWQTLVFFGVLIGMAAYLNTLGVIPWIGQEMADLVEGTHWLVAFGILSLVYFYVHYLFASNTAQITAMYAVFLSTSIAAGAPPIFAALALGFIGNLFGGLTHYASGPSGVIAGSGYVKVAEWFRIAFVMSIPVIVIWTSIGGLWMYLTGSWD